MTEDEVHHFPGLQPDGGEGEAFRGRLSEAAGHAAVVCKTYS